MIRGNSLLIYYTANRHSSQGVVEPTILLTWAQSSGNIGLANLLLQFPEHLRIKELRQRNTKPIADHLDRHHAGILAGSVQNILHRRRRDTGTARQRVDRHIPLLAQFHNPIGNTFSRCHAATPSPTGYSGIA